MPIGSVPFWVSAMGRPNRKHAAIAAVVCASCGDARDVSLGHDLPDALPSPVLSATRFLDDDMATVPAGSFIMGCTTPPGEGVGEDPDCRCGPYELSPRTLELGAYEIDRYEVTPRVYQTCVDRGLCPPLTAPY